MGVLEGIEPAPVFHFFEKICSIPHGSGNEAAVSDYLKQFAQERGLFCIQDEWKNIIIVKEAASGREAEETLILQGHMDMVAVKEPDCDIDMEKEPLRLVVNGDEISAEGTSLGGDDGIAAAYILALLDSREISHPRLEAVLTVGEEAGMDGAREIDLSMLRGRRMLNLDNEEEGVLLASCAGGLRADCRLPVVWEKRSGSVLHIQVAGLQGGHSGAEIVKEGGNANCLMGRALDALVRETSASLLSMKGGLADNAIPRQADARVMLKEEEKETALAALRGMEEKFRQEFSVKDPGVRVVAEEEGELDADCLQAADMEKAVRFLLAMPNGIQAMSADVEGLVETSLNLGIMELTADCLRLSYAVRSSLESGKEAVCRKMAAVSYLAGASMELRGDYPGWAYRKDSPLRDKMISVYERMYGEKPQVQAIHAGLECGLFAGKLQGLDCISCGPDMKGIHTAEEVLSISSVKRVWEYLLEILA
ncbi:MAG: aminoacyl-histidine dipeptidase [Blautia sp.]|nr:aminoacyl-histidine dipeptidase [Blautia sp.]MCM1199760.1 aminoacyl-histidine dipeptidase [Bacteroides fragilis]